MTDRTQFEAMLEALINEDQETAKEIFHNIVVAKSREIYQELLESDFSLSEGDSNPFAKDDEGSEEESSEEESDDSEESDDGEESDDSEESDDDGEVGGDAGDDFIDDTEDDGEEGGEGDEGLEDRVMDLEDALEDLKAEFEQLMAGEEHEEHEHPGIHGDGMPDTDMANDMGMGSQEDEMSFMEGVEMVKVGEPYKGGKVASTADHNVGANTGGGMKAAFNRQSTVSGKMVNNMGGSTKNIAQNFAEKDPNGTTPNKHMKGIAQESGTQFTGTDWEQNSAPGKTSTKAFTKKVTDGHGAEKKGGKGGMVGTGAHSQGFVDDSKNTVINGKKVR